MIDSNIVVLDDFRKPAPDVPKLDVSELDKLMNDEDKLKFKVDTVADGWANDMVHALMLNFAERGTNIDFNDPVYGKLILAVTDVARSMTRHHLGVFDETALMIQKYPEAEVSVGVITMDEEQLDD